LKGENESMERLEKPIFIGGCGSSGTTLLRKMLNMHPNIACGEELSVFDRPRLYDMDMNHFYTYWRNQDFDRFDEDCMINIRVNLAGRPIGENNKSYFAWNRDSYFKPEEWETFFNEAISPPDFFNLALSEYARRQGKKRWAEKTPNNVFEIKRILKAFPDAVFIEVIRDGRDVVLSLTERRGSSIENAVYRWMLSINCGSAFSDGIKRFLSDTDNTTYVIYEDLVKRPVGVLKDLCKFIGEKYDPIMLEYWKKKYNTEEEVNTLGYGKKPVFTSSVGKWKKKGVKPLFLRHMRNTIWDLLENLGYEV
jgi:hypothetical protein